MQQMRKHAVWELTPEKEAVGGKKVRLKWVDLRRGDEVRSRLVAMEVAYDFRPESETFAGTPPLSIIRLLISIAATGAMEGPTAMLITIYDVSCAFLHSLIDELIWIRFPPGLGPAGYVGKLLKSMYGTRRASLLWGEHVSTTFTDNDFERAKGCGQLYFGKTRNITCGVHGDDFLSEGTEKDLDWLDDVAAPRAGEARATSHIRLAPALRRRGHRKQLARTWPACGVRCVPFVDAAA